MAQLPEIKITCRNDHTFPTRARGSSSISCPLCKADGQRVTAWVPKDRPRSVVDARASAPRPALAGRWAREPAWAGRLVILPGGPDDDCPKCRNPLHWEPGRTLVYCGTCNRATLPAVVAEHYQRRDQTRAEVATRAAPDKSAERAARVQLRTLAQRMNEQVNKWINAFDPDGLSGTAERLALDYQAELAAYLPEIKRAESERELTEIMAEIMEVANRAQKSGELATIQRQREAIERQLEQAEREAEWEAEQAELAAQAEHQAAVEARAERKAIESRAESKPVPKVAMGYQGGNGYVSVGVIAMTMIQKYQAERERLLSERGSCGYPHRKRTVAERRYWICNLDWQGNQTPHGALNAPSALICKKHFAEADQWIEEQAAIMRRTQSVQILAVHTELT